MCLSIYAHEMHLIMEAVSLWTRPPALHLCAGPLKKNYPSFQLLRPTAGTGRCGITATSTTVDELREDIHHGICRCTQRACNDTCTTDVDHLVNVLQLENLNDHGNRPVRNDRDVNDELQLRRVHSLQQS